MPGIDTTQDSVFGDDGAQDSVFGEGTTQDTLISERTTKDSVSPSSPPHPTYLIWGTHSWIASHLLPLLQHHPQNPKVHSTTVRLESRCSVIDELRRVRPTHVFNCAGVTGRPNVDWCEDHKLETMTSNVVGAINLAICCQEMGVHLTVFATGCIYTSNSTHPPGGPGYLETDPANFTGSFYSLTKIVAENYQKHLPLLLLRLRMPVSDTLHPRSFLTKITTYPRIASAPNSHTILHDLLPCAILLATHRETGVYNFTNPGCITHNEVLTMYKEIVRPEFSWKNFSLEEQSRVLKAGRSNCVLDVSKLVAKMGEYGYQVPEIREGYRACFERMVANGTKAGDDVKMKEGNRVESHQPVKSTMKRKRVDEEEELTTSKVADETNRANVKMNEENGMESQQPAKTATKRKRVDDGEDLTTSKTIKVS